MLDLKYYEKFKMSFILFKQLVLKMTPFFESIVDYVVWASIPV
jgi:hypothetical protein